MLPGMYCIVILCFFFGLFGAVMQRIMKRNVDIYLCGDCNKLFIIVSQLDSVLYSRNNKIARKKSLYHIVITQLKFYWEYLSVKLLFTQFFPLLLCLQDYRILLSKPGSTPYSIQSRSYYSLIQLIE